MLVFPSFPLSPLPGVRPGSISLSSFSFSFFFFGPIFDAMFSRHDIIPPPPHASTVEAGVFCCGLGFGAFSIHLVWI